MTFDNLGDDGLELIKQEITASLRGNNLSFEAIKIDFSEDEELLEVRGIVASDPMLDASWNTGSRQILALLRMFLRSPDDDSEVIWGQLTYLVNREHSNFFPVPQEYGDYIHVEYGWEFDRVTLQIRGPAQVRDLGRLHYVSVLPNETFVTFVHACSQVVERWA